MSDRKIGDTDTHQLDMTLSSRACNGAPVTIQPGAVVAMADALENCVQVLGMDC